MSRYSIYSTEDKANGITLGVIVIGLGLYGLTKCAQVSGNRDMVDLTKSYNAALEQTDTGIAITYINGYYDYEGSQIQFITQDQLFVLADTKDLQLINQPSYGAIMEYATTLNGGDSSTIRVYDEICGLGTPEQDSFNKHYLDMMYDFPYAIIQTESGVVIAEVSEWRDYDDNKMQIKLSDGTIFLTDFNNIKLVNDDLAKEDSLYNYALTLAGSEDRVTYYNAK